MDLAHDFLVEELPRVARTYQPSRGAIEDYVFRAFLFFARPRLQRSTRWRAQLLDIRDLRTVSEPEVSDDERAALVCALNVLSDGERRVIDAVFFSGASIRAVANDLGMSRYHVRELVTNALAKLLMNLAPDVLPATDRKIATMLFIDRATPAEVAAVGGWTVGQVLSTRDRVLSRFHVGRQSARDGKDDRG
jgi:RNA polymerase sigma factor (sigma-70 family)